MQKKILTALAASLLWVVPALADAQAAIKASDTIAGVGTEVTVKGLDDGTALLAVLPPYGSELLYDITLLDGRATVQIPGTDVRTAGQYDVSVEQAGSIVLQGGKFTVFPDSIDTANSTVQTDRDYLRYDLEEDATVTVILRDQFGNPIPDRPIRLISSRSSDFVQTLNEQTDVDGQQSFSVVAGEPGALTLRAMDLLSGDTIGSEVRIEVGSLTASRGGFPEREPAYNTNSYQNSYAPTNNNSRAAPTANTRTSGNQFIGTLSGRPLYGQVSTFGSVDQFLIDVPQTMRANVDENLTITAVDSQGNVVEDYLGSVLLSSTDPNAILPGFGEVSFRGADLGRKTLVLGLRFASPGQQTLYIEDSADPSVNGTATIEVTGSSQTTGRGDVDITSPKNGDVLQEKTVTVEGIAPPFINLAVSGGTDDAFGESDRTGRFSIEVELDPEEQEHTLMVRDQSGRGGQDEVTVKLDVLPPVIESVHIEPAEPEVEQESTVTLTLAEEEKDAKLSVLIEELELERTFERVTGKSRQYQTTLSFDEVRDYTLHITATDQYGNSVEQTETVSVQPRGLPQVQNVQAEPRPNAIQLQWDAVAKDVEIDGYRIYIGDSESSFLFTLETEGTVTAATIAGLEPGLTYFFALTALQGERESEEKSAVVSSGVIGLQLTVTPGDGNLRLDWNDLNAQNPLSQYLLEYGVAEGVYTEQRTLSGESTSHTMRDLLNDVTYHLRLSPIAVNGEVLEELVTTSSGAPGADAPGYHPGAPDPIPNDLSSVRVQPDIVRSGAPRAPSQPITGIPSSGWWLLATAVVTVGYLLIRNRRTSRATQEFLKNMEWQYRSGGSDDHSA